MPPISPLRAFGALWFFYFAAIGVFNPYSSLWFKDLGFSTLAIGTIASLQAWTRVVAPYGWGWLGDHGAQRVRLLQMAVLATVLAAVALLLAKGYAAVAFCTMLLFLANGGVVPLAEASLARHLQTAQGLDSGRYGRVRVWGSLGFVLAVLAFGLVFESFGIALFPWVVLACYGWLSVVALRLPSGDEPGHDSSATPPVLSVLRRPAVAWFFASIFFTVLAHTGLYTFFSLYLDQMGHGKTTVGMLWAVAAAFEIAFFWWQGRLFPSITPHTWLKWAAVAALLRFAATAAFGSHLMVLVLAQMTHAISFGAHHAACIALVSRHFPGALRGRGQALYSVLGYGSSGVIGGVAGGWLSSRHGFAAVFWAASVAAAVGCWCAVKSERSDAAATPA